MPERTVDTWAALAICAVFPEARIWDPTQAMKGRNWDRSFLPREAGSVFILEDKGTTAVTRTRKRPLQTHRIDIGSAQLDWYCDEVEPASTIPVYYVLPRPPWTGGASSGHVPEEAACRIASDCGPFAQWAYVSRCTDLRRELARQRRRSIDTDQLPLPGGSALQDFLRDVRCGKAGRSLPPDDRDVQRSTGGLSAEPEAVPDDSPAGSALAVFVPADNLASQDPDREK
jgi:hypothetical protein